MAKKKRRKAFKQPFSKEETICTSKSSCRYIMLDFGRNRITCVCEHARANANNGDLRLAGFRLRRPFV